MAFYFRLPKFTELTIEQRAVLNETRSIAISGGPGTGKSVVALWRHIRNHDTNKRKSLLLTYTKSLEAYLRASAKSENESAGKYVNRTYYWTSNNSKYSKDVYGEIIIDEAQDVEQEKYEIIKGCTSMVSYSADDNQMLYPNKGVSENQLKTLFSSNNSYTLRENFRNTHEIVHFVRSMFPSRLISSGKISGPKPTVICSDGNNDLQIKIILDVIKNFQSNTHNIAVLVPIKDDVNKWYSILQNNGIRCTKFVSSDGSIMTIENVHITTFKSSKGLEFDTVILPDFDQYENNIDNYYVVEENDYYVVFTRARRNLILLDNGRTNNGKCDLSFLSLPIVRSIVNVDYDYINKSSQSFSPPSSIEDDLPF